MQITKLQRLQTKSTRQQQQLVRGSCRTSLNVCCQAIAAGVAPLATPAVGVPRRDTSSSWTPKPAQLYEEHFKLPIMQQTVTSQEPKLHRMSMMLWSMELRFRMLAHSVERVREHKQPQFEKDAAAVARDCGFLSDHMEELQEAHEGLGDDGLFPTVQGPSNSLGLTSLLAAISSGHKLTISERKSFVKSVLRITAEYTASFSHLSVGLGIEQQLNAVLEALGLPATVPEHKQNINYELLVQQRALEAMLSHEGQYNPEHYFFRGCHLIIEAWVHVINSNLQAALPLAKAGQWDDASWRMLQVARMLEHAGEQFSSLQSMCLVDFYGLRVLVDGLSGTGSIQVMSIKKNVLRLLAPFAQEAKQVKAGLSCNQITQVDCALLEAFRINAEQRDALQATIHIYANPDQHAGLYRYGRALESLESAVLGGFFYKHYGMVSNVIGCGVKKHAVPHLKHTYEAQMFPLLNAARSLLADRIEGEMLPLKGHAVEDDIQNLKDGRTAASSWASMAPSHAAEDDIPKSTAASPWAAMLPGHPAVSDTSANAQAQKRSKCPFLAGLANSGVVAWA